MQYLRREDVITELVLVLPMLLDAARCEDNIPDERVVALERRYTTRLSASDAELTKLVLDTCDLARALWKDAEQEEDLADLFAIAGRVVQEASWAEAQRREGLKQERLPLFKQRRAPE